MCNEWIISPQYNNNLILKYGTIKGTFERQVLVIYKLKKKVKVLPSIIVVIFIFLENRESFMIYNSESTLVCLVYIDPL